MCACQLWPVLCLIWECGVTLPVLVEINCSQPVVFDLPGTEILDIDEGLSKPSAASAAHASKAAAAAPPASAAPAGPVSTLHVCVCVRV